MSSNEEENETFGPKVGIKLSKDQAATILKRHFPHLTLVKFSHINRGYNNRVYTVTASNGIEYILRLTGRFWSRYKTENEVAALLYLARHCSSLPVPKIYGYCTDPKISGINAEYILMEKLEGVPLDHVWDQLDLADKKNIINQMAIFVSMIQGIRFPQIGSFQFSSEAVGNVSGSGVNPETYFKEDEEILRVGRGVEFDDGPFNTFSEYFINTCKTEIDHLKKCAFMRESDGYCERLKRIENFICAFESEDTLPKGMSKEVLQNVPFVFTHGDLEPRNLLVNKETMKITGVLDWEFAGSYPVDEEWFTGFAFVDGDTTDWRTFNEERPIADDEQPSHPEMINLLREHFLEQMRKNGVAIPDDIPGHMIRAELYYFKGFICPWWLREKRNPIPETHYNDRNNACKKVDYILEKYGF